MKHKCDSVREPQVAALVASSASAIAGWVEAVRGGGQLSLAIARVIDLVGADYGLIVRRSEETGRTRQVASTDRENVVRAPSHGPETILGAAIFDAGRKPKPGIVWTLSDVRETYGAALPAWLEDRLQRRSLHDAIGFALDNHGLGTDFFEVQYRTPAPGSAFQMLSAVSHELARTWSKRLPGVGERETSRLRVLSNSGHEQTPRLDVLSADNPADLSRSEFRVSMMLREGMKVRDICERLGVCEATVRSHLSAIYAKTGCAGQVELLHMLFNAPDAGESERKVS